MRGSFVIVGVVVFSASCTAALGLDDKSFDGATGGAANVSATASPASASVGATTTTTTSVTAIAATSGGGGASECPGAICEITSPEQSNLVVVAGSAGCPTNWATSTSFYDVTQPSACTCDCNPPTAGPACIAQVTGFSTALCMTPLMAAPIVQAACTPIPTGAASVMLTEPMPQACTPATQKAPPLQALVTLCEPTSAASCDGGICVPSTTEPICFLSDTACPMNLRETRLASTTGYDDARSCAVDGCMCGPRKCDVHASIADDIGCTSPTALTENLCAAKGAATSFIATWEETCDPPTGAPKTNGMLPAATEFLCCPPPP